MRFILPSLFPQTAVISEPEYVVTTATTDFHAVKTGLESKKFVIAESEAVAMVPKNTVKVEGATAQQLLKLLEEVEGLDDVQKVWANFDIDDTELPSG